MQVPRGPVGIVSTNIAGLEEVASVLIREGVGIARAIGVAGGGQKDGVSVMLQGFRAVRADPAAKVIVLVAETMSEDAARRILSQVRDSQKPTFVCFLGTDQRLAWRAGGIPAARLDEAAMRAAAWVRGWDQALVSSRLEEQADKLATFAKELRGGIGPGRRLMKGFFTDPIFFREAQLVLFEVVGAESVCEGLHVVPDPTLMARHLRAGFDDLEAAVILSSVVLDRDMAQVELLRELMQAEADAPLRGGQDGPLVIAYLCSSDGDPQQLAEQEVRLHDVGIVVAASNAAAAQLAGNVINGQAGRS
jgi:FdrA protein